MCPSVHTAEDAEEYVLLVSAPTMPTYTPCTDCTYLVGAGPERETHAALYVLERDSDGKADIFRCGTCHCRWTTTLLGWTRVAEPALRLAV